MTCNRCPSTSPMPLDEVSRLRLCASCWSALAWDDSFYPQRIATYRPGRQWTPELRRGQRLAFAALVAPPTQRRAEMSEFPDPYEHMTDDERDRHFAAVHAQSVPRVSDEVLGTLLALLDAATHGPWALDDDGCCVYKAAGDATIAHVGIGGADGSAADATLIVAARNALPSILADLSSLRAERDAAVKERNELREACRALEALPEVLRLVRDPTVKASDPRFLAALAAATPPTEESRDVPIRFDFLRPAEFMEDPALDALSTPPTEESRDE